MERTVERLGKLREAAVGEHLFDAWRNREHVADELLSDGAGVGAGGVNRESENVAGHLGAEYGLVGHP